MGIEGDNRKLIEDIFAEMARGRPQAMSALMAEDCRWVFPGTWSWSGTWEPREVVLTGLLRPLMRQLTDYRAEADWVRAAGDHVFAQVRGHATTIRGERYDNTYLYVFRLRDGHLTEVVEHCDTALVERVLETLIPPQRP